MTQYNPKPQAAKSSSKLLWILLSIFGGGFLLCCGVCGGAALWFSRFPAVGEEAREPFEYASVPIPSFEKGEFIEVDEVPETYQVRQIILGDGTGYGNVPGLNGVLWHYGPKEIAKGTKLPCVLIAPAGSTLLTGMELGDGDATEHIPYLKAGFAVIAYSLDGPSLSNPPDIPAYEAYSQARGGLVNARNALEYAIQQPEIDPKRIFVAGIVRQVPLPCYSLLMRSVSRDVWRTHHAATFKHAFLCRLFGLWVHNFPSSRSSLCKLHHARMKRECNVR